MLYFILALNLSGWDILTAVLGYLCAMAVGIVFHEVAHAFVAHKCGDDTAKLMGRVSFNPFAHLDPMGMLMFLFVGFGWAKPVPVNELNFRNFKRGQRLVSMAGIVTNLVLAFIFSGLYYFFFPYLISHSNLFLNFVGYFLLFAFAINISLAIFNLFPIYPLDGFNFLRSFMKPTNKFVLFMESYGSLILILLLITSAFDYVYSFFLNLVEQGFFAFWGLF